LKYALGERRSHPTCVLLIFVIAVFLFFSLEIALRIYKTVNPAFVLMPDDTYMRYRGRPFSPEYEGFRLNSKGYKYGEFNTEKPPGVYRIIGIGDSFTYGAVPYEQCYMTLLEEQVRRIRNDCEILNLGIPAAGPVDYLSLFVNEGLALAPDMVLVNLYVGDDFFNGGKRFKLYSYSAAATWINTLIANWRKQEGRIFGSGMYRDDRPLQSEESYLQYLVDIQIRSFLKGDTQFKEDFESSLSFIKEIKRICDLKKIAFAVVICPTDIQLCPFLQKKLALRLHKRPDDFDFRLPDWMLAREFNMRHVAYYDLLDFFVKAYKKEGKGFNKPNDPHWNVYGNRLAAEQVAPWLLGQMGGKNQAVRTDNLR
jgi:hypothetical protein